ncbi:AfsR/SARP family transcriptional regulator [Stenotrophomonas mori]|uniref:Bacterial transcriptional activator domain-containing protein n=1 Tax=Stenotrophomonas mori TaxID=2871096 RepID=A0ABT0SJG9_9GAMM|nr:BTAD domain-containing putative transcriptional regulator [Stenotrophomonas mori]MCL7715145.1 hypothetical protein [Stenotrophomonas mori]
MNQSISTVADHRRGKRVADGQCGVTIHLLGECRITGTTGQRLRLAYRKGWALLAYLAVERSRTHRRGTVAAMLWPDLPQAAALTNLRQVLADLNRTLTAATGRRLLVVDRDTLRLCPAASQGVFDIDRLEAGPPACTGQAWLEDAGELLDGIALEECEAFCEWLPGARMWAWQHLLRALDAARDQAEASGGLDAALRIARRQVALDPWDETRQRHLMRLHARLGEPDRALDCYRLLERGLARELALEPQAATRTLAQDIARRQARSTHAGRLRHRPLVLRRTVGAMQARRES